MEDQANNKCLRKINYYFYNMKFKTKKFLNFAAVFFLSAVNIRLWEIFPFITFASEEN